MIMFQATVPSCTDLNDKIPVERRTDIMWQSHAVSRVSTIHRSWAFVKDSEIARYLSNNSSEIKAKHLPDNNVKYS